MAELNLDEVIEAVKRDDNSGFCLACGNEQMDCEPDLRDGTCDDCGENRVYGAEECLLLLA